MDDVAEQALVAAIRERGGRVTPQRLIILRALCDEPRHVTAEDLLASVEQRLPGVSLPTIYATLDLFERLGVVRRVPTAGGTIVYDSRAGAHHHLVCRSCGAVSDLEAPLDASGALAAARDAGFECEDASLTVLGRCASCAAAA
jgi:Fur family ferric uptake transcriptional regulator/Fur family peroxide stress response transcriptional regulator